MKQNIADVSLEINQCGADGGRHQLVTPEMGLARRPHPRIAVNTGKVDPIPAWAASCYRYSICVRPLPAALAISTVRSCPAHS
jgi:hypothetical protein